MNDTHNFPADTHLDQALRQLHREVLDEPVPASMLAAADHLAAVHAHHRRTRQWLQWSGMAASLVMAFALGWLGSQWMGPSASLLAAASKAMPAQRFAQAATVAHAVYLPEVRHPVEVAAAQQEHLVQWLSKRLGRPLKVPNLQPEGYELMGGRLLPGDVGARAQFMFQNAAGDRVTLYLGAVTDQGMQETAFRYLDDGHTAPTFYWVSNGFGYALTGKLSRAALLSLANRVHGQV
jgi:anti-sigma factor RsiW